MLIYIYVYIRLYTDIDIGHDLGNPSFRAPRREETLAEKRRMKEQQEEKKLKAPRWIHVDLG